MANHSPRPDNYVTKKTWAEAMQAQPAKPNNAGKVAADKAKRAADKGEAAHNGGGPVPVPPAK